jgi:hypothetical protein
MAPTMGGLYIRHAVPGGGYGGVEAKQWAGAVGLGM